MKPNNTKKWYALKGAEVWILLAATVALLLFALLEVQLHIHPATLPHSVLLRIVLSVLICLLFYLGGMLYADRTGDVRIFRRLLLFFFFLYLYLLLNVTLFEKGFGRHHLVEGDGSREYYLRYFVNLVPFQSIGEVYIMGLIKGYVSPYYVLLNLLGNVCVFMPLSFFLPTLLGAMRRWYVFVPTLVVSVALVELLQFIFMVGSCDVDDLILNVFGALLFYFLLRLPPLQRLCRRIIGQPPKNNGGTKQ